MSLIAKDTGNGAGGDYTPVPEGTHAALCNMVVDLGLQETNFQGVPAVKHQCFVRWELPNERIEYTDKKSGQVVTGPMLIGKFYTVSLHEKSNLRKDLEGWRGRAFTPTELQGFDLFKLAGVPCQVSVVHVKRADRTFSNVVAVAGWPKGVAKPKGTETGILLYSPKEQGQLPDLPQWIINKLDKRIEEPTAAPVAPPVDDLDDSIPF